MSNKQKSKQKIEKVSKMAVKKSFQNFNFDKNIWISAIKSIFWALGFCKHLYFDSTDWLYTKQ